MPKTALIKDLEGILTPEQANAFSAKIDLLVEEKAEERANAILEEERVEMKAKLAKSAEEFVGVEVKKARDEFDSLLQEEKKNFETRLVEEIKVLEEKLIPTLDKVLEEQVNTVLPNDVQEKLALFEIYQPIIVGSQKLFEEHLAPLTADADAQISKLKNDVIQLNEELEVTINESESRSLELEKTKKLLLLEEKGVNLTESQKSRAFELFEESTFDMMKERIDSTVQMLEEQNGFHVSDPHNENKDSDMNPNATIEDGGEDGKILEEEKKAISNVWKPTEVPLNAFKQQIEGLL